MDTLKLDENIIIGPEESLISIGLDSICTVIINEKIESSLNISIGISRIMEADSISGILQLIQSRLHGLDSKPVEYEEGEI